jgi:SAM-dependent methyltransferase
MSQASVSWAARTATPALSPCDRRLHWVSSVSGDPAVLAGLDEEMSLFYGTEEKRHLYQGMLDSQEDSPIAPDTVADHLTRRVVSAGAIRALEVGCGNGWLYRHLLRLGYPGSYSGMEVGEHIIRRNAERHSEATWLRGTAYDIPLSDGAVDVCFAFYVLEHTVYPERALREMLRVLRPGGTLLLAFPDFTVLGYLPSQLTGFSPGGARVKWRAGRWWDALVTLVDSRLRQRRAMRKVAAGGYGGFPVNARPICLTHPAIMWADVDAVYVASKREVAAWFARQGFRVEFPCGTDGLFARHAYLTVQK